VYFQLTLEENHASVVVNYVAFETAAEDPQINTEMLRKAVEQARIRPALALDSEEGRSIR
jgi:hypothetical protein